jgi:TonB family protein
LCLFHKSPSNGNGSASNIINNNSSKPNGSSPGDNGKSTTQCLRNCTIKYPDEFQDSDVGKGKISIRVTIDGNGIVSTAEIVRSSENQKLDYFALEATKKMQFNATGETRIRRIKVNTISNN